MKKNVLVYVKGLTKGEAQKDIRNIESYCSDHDFNIVETIFDETKDVEKDYECLEKLYKHMISGNIHTIIFNSYYYFYPLEHSVNYVAYLANIETVKFFNSILISTRSNDIITFGQVTLD